VPAPPRHRLALAALRLVPKHALSRGVGWLAGRRLPRALRGPVLGGFARAVGVDRSELAAPLASFASLQDFFTRGLPEGARPLDADPAAVLAPCDGFWGACGRVEAGTLLQVKGRPYSLAALLGSARQAERFEGGGFATFYLSPRDYHRFHAPCAGRVVEARYLPGSLWPVNAIGVHGVPGLFAENERLWVALAPPSAPAERVVVVSVGATLVGKVRLDFDTLCTHPRVPGPVRRDYGVTGPELRRGQQYGRFEFGSSLVLVATPGSLRLEPEAPGTPLRLGRRIGRLEHPGGASSDGTSCHAPS